MEATPEVIAELRPREPVFHMEPEGADEAHFEAMLVDDYFEVGASGRVYSRENVMEIVLGRYGRGEPGIDNEVEDFRVRKIDEHVFIATYTLNQPDGHTTRSSRRSTVWTNAAGHWQVVYHQGTLLTS